MATSTFKLSGKTIPLIIEIVRAIIAKLVLNIAVYATPNPTILTLTALVDQLDLDYQAALNGGKDKKAVMRLSKKKLLDAMAALLGYIQTTSGGDANKILLVCDVKKKASPVGILPAPSNVRGIPGHHDGEIRWMWDGVKRKKIYPMQINDTPGDDTKWVDAGLTGKTRHTSSGLVSGKQYAFRIATISADGQGPWSDPAVQKAK